MQPTKILRSKSEQLWRLLYLHGLTKLFSTVLVCEYPKSGGTWLGQLISTYLQISFPRNRHPMPGNNLFHGHYLPGKYLKWA